MREIAAAYRVDMRDVMYVGDSGNDLSALRVVGHPIAMGNRQSSGHRGRGSAPIGARR